MAQVRDGVTIAIPNWNHELLLPRSVFSGLQAVAQLREHGVAGEVLVVDDCSRDGSRVLLRGLEARYYKQGLRVLAPSQNKGLGAARNLALAHASYRHIAFMDADNELVPQNLRAFHKALCTTRAAAAYGNLIVRTLTSKVGLSLLSNEPIQNRLFQNNYIDAFAMFDRIQLLDMDGYDEVANPLEDYDCWLHLASNGRNILFVPLVFGYYYILPGSMITDGESGGKAERRVQRMYNQIKARKWLSLNTRHLRYHPDLGYL